MSKKSTILLSEDALPDIFIKVAEAKRMLQVGEAQTVGEAARRMNISRSAFYKYKDAVQPLPGYEGRPHHYILRPAQGQPGSAEQLPVYFANSGANILTINQTIPTNGCAGVTISAETSDMKEGLDEMMAGISAAFWRAEI